MLAFQDEASVCLLPGLARSYAPIGRPPVMLCDTKNKDYVSISGAIISNGQFYFEVREQEGFKRKGLTRFLTNCRKQLRNDLLLIWDNAPAHKSQVVKEYLAQQSREHPGIWLEHLPTYSPELNPIEQVWAYLKSKLSNRFFQNTKALKLEVIRVLKEVKKNKKLIISFFRNHELNCYQFFS